MTLAAERLDDLSWSDLVGLARAGIAPRSGGQWTLHAPVDPGITMLELFAYLLEQRVYWVDQLPPAFVRAALELLGVVPRGAAWARTVFAVEPGTAATSVAEGVQFALVGTLPELVFTTRASCTVLDVAELHLFTRGGDRSEDLRNGRRITLLPASGAGEFRVGLRLAAQPVAHAGHPLAILIELDSHALGVPPQWSADAVAVGAPAEIELVYRTPTGEAVFAEVDDGTGGLRRSGVMRLSIPADWAPEPGSIDAAGRQRWDVVVRCADPSFSSPPRAHAIRANAVIADHRRAVCLYQRLRPRPLPGNEVMLASEAEPPIIETLQLHMREASDPDVWSRWEVGADFGRSGAADRVAVVHRDDRRLVFGDGLVARLPVVAAIDPQPGSPVPDSFDTACPVPAGPDVPNVRVTYHAGGGERGNVGAGGTWLERGGGVAPRAATNVVVAEGGLEPETLAEARDRAGGELRSVARAVTAEDHCILAITTPGVAIARAHAAVGFDPLHPCVAVPGTTSVFVVPRVPRGVLALGPDGVSVGYPLPDAAAIAAVRARLDERRLAGSVVHVLPPRYRSVSVAIVLLGDPLDPETTRRRVVEAITRYFDPLEGGDDRDGWPFGGPIRPSSLARIADQAADDEARVRTVAIGIDDAPASEECRELAILAHELPRLARLDVAIALPEEVGT